MAVPSPGCSITPASACARPNMTKSRAPNSGFIGHLIERNLMDVKAKRIERDIQTDDRIVAEVNELCIAETQIGHHSAPSRRPQVREKRHRQRNMECKSLFRWHGQR